MFCFGVYTASHLINRAYTPHLARLGLTYPQYITLTLLWERDGQTVSDLATQLRMGTNTVTPLVKRLEASGLVTRTRSKTDGREIVVRLTAKSRDLRSEAPQITACMVEATTLDHDELRQLQELLTKLAAGLAGAPNGSGSS